MSPQVASLPIIWHVYFPTRAPGRKSLCFSIAEGVVLARGHAAARLHHVSWWHGGYLAAWRERSAAGLPVIGYLSSGTPQGFARLVDAFRQGLNEAGLVEARNVRIEFRWSEGQDQRLPAMVAELIQQHAAVIVATGGSAPAVAAKSATATVPIVFTGGQDPVKLGLVESLGRPGGNATGVLNIAPALTSKRLELLRELAAKPELIAVLKTIGMGSEDQVAELVPAAAQIGQKIEIFNINAESEFDASFVAIARARAGALYVLADPFFTSRAARLIALAGQYTLPASYSFRSFAVAGA
jgi:putative tryptophan/tyrosine transport system substrate-binding protein